jgi:hypothetical protein
MRKKLFFLIGAASIICLLSAKAYAGEVDVLINKLVEKGVLSPSEAQIVMDDTKLRVSKDLAQGESYSVPDWTQRIKWGGDVRFRTQGDWYKSTNTATGAPAVADQQWRNRIRGRFYMQAKVNDFTYAGVRFAGGGQRANTTNDTLNNYWNKQPVEFDQYYVMFTAPKEVIRDYGKYFSDVKLWMGRIPNPFQYSELMWDPNINPEGVAIQYVSPDLKVANLPAVNLYSNAGMLWIDQNALFNADHYPMLWALQGGVKTEKFGPFASTVDVSTAMYDFTSMVGKTYTGVDYAGNAGTNSRNAQGLWNFNYQVLDVLVSIDNDKILDYEFPHGLYGDFIHNAEGSSINNLNNGFLIGGYIGKKNVKEPGDWKVKAEARYIERDALPDFMTDSDFDGFGTWAATAFPSTAANLSNNNGVPLDGGTNGKGYVLGFDYVLFKNTVLNVKWYWMKPIKSDDITAPFAKLMMDVVTKF